MKKEGGVALATLVIYLMIITATLTALSVLTGYIYKNSQKMGSENLTSEEFNKFNVEFIKSVKKNKKAQITSANTGNVTIVFDDKTTYTYVKSENAIYKNKIKIAKNINYFEATAQNINSKDTIKIKIGTGKTGKESDFGKTINYVLKYW